MGKITAKPSNNAYLRRNFGNINSIRAYRNRYYAAMPLLLTNHPQSAERAASLEASRHFDDQCADNARIAFEKWSSFAPTPLLSLAGVAHSLGIGSLLLKDERARLDLGSFKGLGGAYAVFTLAAEAEGIDSDDPVELGAFIARRQSEAVTRTMPLTVTTATAGNHGRSVAAGAGLMGIDCVIVVYDGVPPDQIDAIAAHGARIVHVAGDYEDAVERCRSDAESNGWVIISDTSWQGYDEVPLRIMEGYTLMVAEAIAAMDEPPTHVFLQAGVGGMAAAVAAHLAIHYGDKAPKLIVVEPDRAPCLFASLEAGKITTVPRAIPTSMGRLECYTPSLVAWAILSGVADMFVQISDDEAVLGVELLQAWGLETSPSGAAGFAGLLALLEAGERARLGLDSGSRVLAFITEARPTAQAQKREVVATAVAAIQQ